MDFISELAKIAPNARKGGQIFLFGVGENWRKLRHMYKALAGINLEDFVDAFVDNDPNKQNTILHGKKIIPPAGLDPDHSVVLVAASPKDLAIEKQLAGMGFYCDSSFITYGHIEGILRRYLYARISQFKDKHKGERCFIIGNGPSLRPGDLDKIKNEITFATNKIYRMFDKTDWRPTYYQVGDYRIFEEPREINELITCTQIFQMYSMLTNEDFLPDVKRTFFYSSDACLSYRLFPYSIKFSPEPDVLGTSFNITYDVLQIAAYMGFSEIYLLGVDNDYPVLIRQDGEITFRGVQDHFYPGQTFKSMDPTNFNVDRCNAAYKCAREYADAHGFKIYNATRGGKLEVFERVDFDTLF